MNIKAKNARIKLKDVERRMEMLLLEKKYWEEELKKAVK